MPRRGFQLRSDMSRNVGQVGGGFGKQCLLVGVHTRLKALQFAISVGRCLQQNAPPRNSQISSSLQFEQILCKYHSYVHRPLFHYCLENFPPSGVSPALFKTVCSSEPAGLNSGQNKQIFVFTIVLLVQIVIIRITMHL